MPVYHIITANQRVSPSDTECHELRYNTMYGVNKYLSLLGYRLYLLLHNCDPDGGCHLNLRLDPGRGLEGGPLREVCHGLRPPSTPLRH